ncbi:MAG: M1 family aminopeptidase [Candidatus Acidiferrales bacterium]
MIFQRAWLFRLLACAAALCGSFCVMQTSAGQDATAAWNAVNQAPFNAVTAAHVENLTLVRDRIRITLVDGTLQFTQPANGFVFGAAFTGRGRIEITPPNPTEAQQLQLFAKVPTLNADFDQATVSFTDGTFDEVAKEVKWTSAGDNSLADLYQKRQRTREDLAAEIVPRIFEGVLSGDHQRTAYFAAELKTSNDGWILAKYDALEPEEISVGRYASRGTPAMLFDTWMSFPAGGANASQVFQEPLKKDVFLAHGYQIDATVTGGADLSATTKVNLQYQATGERVLVFSFSANLRVSSVKDEGGTALPFFQPREPNDRFPTYGDYVAVVLPQPTQTGQAATLTFQYEGKHMIEEVGTGNYFCPSYGWYPGVADDFATRADFDMTFHTPKKLMLVATGDKVGESTDGNWTVTKWKSPMPQAVAGFAFGDYKVYDEKVGNIDVQVYGNRNPDDFFSTMAGMSSIGNLDPSTMIKTTGTEIGNNLRVFQDYFGPFPYQRLAVTNIPYSYGQGWPMLLYLSVLSFMDETQRHILGITDQIRISDYFRAHEVSHQWWGHEVGWKSYHDQWLSEGFAQFSGNLYVEFRDSPKEYVNRLHQDNAEILSRNNFGHRYDDLGPIWLGQRLASSQAPDGYDTVIYDKGGYVLEMLRAMLMNPRNPSPDDGFKAMMQDYVKTFSGQAASTEDFKTIVERHMLSTMDIDHNHRMDWFFNEYVYGTGIAQYHFEYTVQGQPDNKWLVSGTASQSGVPEGWKDLLPIYVHAQGKSMPVGWLQIRGKTSAFKFALPFQPEKISLNDNAEILCEIK